MHLEIIYGYFVKLEPVTKDSFRMVNEGTSILHPLSWKISDHHESCPPRDLSKNKLSCSVLDTAVSDDIQLLLSERLIDNFLMTHFRSILICYVETSDINSFH